MENFRDDFRDNRDLEDGNTNPPNKQVGQLKQWFFTFNNYEVGQIEILETTFRSLCEKYLFQEEVGESGTPHLQGVIFLKKRMRWSELKLPKEINWSKVRNPKACIEYCSKDISHTGGRWMMGIKIPKPLKIIKNLYPWQKEVERICLAEPDDRTIYWFWEPTGKVGKSSFVKYMVVKHKALFCNGGRVHDIVNLVFNQDMDETTTVIFDISRCKKGKVSYESLESIKNGLVCNTKFETGVKVFNSPTVVVFANYPPDDETKLSADRWNITELCDLELGDIEL